MMHNESAAQGFDLFWHSSSLTPTLMAPFATRLQAFSPSQEARLLTYPGADIALPVPGDRLAKTMQSRRSQRTFGPGKVSLPALGSLLSAFATNNRGTRCFPSAGSLYPLEIFCLANGVQGGLSGKILCYNADNHSVSVAGPLPPWESYQASLNMALPAQPQLVFVFVLRGRDMLEKYGERGGRFLLLEVGHAAQNLALRLVQEGLAGYETGGIMDAPVLELLGLSGSGCLAALAYCCGLPVRQGAGRPRRGWRSAPSGQFLEEGNQETPGGRDGVHVDMFLR